MLAALTGVPEESFFELYSNTRDHYDRGHADCNQHWQRFAEVAQVEISADNIDRILAIESEMWTRIDRDTLELAWKIKARGAKIAILSNMPFDLLGELHQTFDWLAEFDVPTWSCELGVVKPDAGIYRTCLAALGCEPGGSLFFDDRPNNVESARQLGMEAYIFESAVQAKAIVERGMDMR